MSKTKTKRKPLGKLVADAPTIEQVRDASLSLLPPIFSKCVESGVLNWNLDALFIWDRYVVATNGEILARMSLDSLGSAGVAIQSILSLVNDRRTPKLGDIPGPTPCQKCGQSRFYRGDDYPGWVSCQRCDGTGWTFDSEYRVRFTPTISISLSFAWLLKQHDAKIYLPFGKAVNKPIRWEIGLVDGLLMPLRQETDPNFEPMNGKDAD